MIKRWNSLVVLLPSLVLLGGLTTLMILLVHPPVLQESADWLRLAAESVLLLSGIGMSIWVLSLKALPPEKELVYVDKFNEEKKEEKSVKELELSIWSKVQQLSLRKPDNQEEKETWLSKLALATEAGIVLLYEKAVQGDQSGYKMSASFGWAGSHQEFIVSGHGLVGTCGVEGRPLVVTEIPSDAHKIISGLGKAVPTQVILLPIGRENQEASAVIELGLMASVQFSKEELERICKKLYAIWDFSTE
jgi:hypothetical protein